MRIFLFSVTQNQPQISSKTRRILKIAIPKLSKEMLKYISEKQPYLQNQSAFIADHAQQAQDMLCTDGEKVLLSPRRSRTGYKTIK